MRRLAACRSVAYYSARSRFVCAPRPAASVNVEIRAAAFDEYNLHGYLLVFLASATIGSLLSGREKSDGACIGVTRFVVW